MEERYAAVLGLGVLAGVALGVLAGAGVAAGAGEDPESEDDGEEEAPEPLSALDAAAGVAVSPDLPERLSLR